VVAIEPSPRNIACLRRNFKEEIAAARVIVYEKGVWDKDDFLTLNESSTAAEDSVVIDSGNGSKRIKVPLTTIDKLVAELKLMRVDYIKMDIEGAEQKALAGARHTLTEYRPRMEISVNHLPEDPDMIPVIVKKARPDYQMECGPCLMDGLRIRPDVVHFR
jgi:FkbM family methyltransferase